MFTSLVIVAGVVRHWNDAEKNLYYAVEIQDKRK
jgi:hypothetical protein